MSLNPFHSPIPYTEGLRQNAAAGDENGGEEGERGERKKDTKYQSVQTTEEEEEVKRGHTH